MCSSDLDPVIFEYINSKTLRINEIWNRSSELQELDLKDFNPKELQKKLITDPEEKAEWEILTETDDISNKILYFENRRELLNNALYSWREFKKLRPQVITILNDLSSIKIQNTKKVAIKSQKEKINEIVEEYSDDPDKMAKEIASYKKSRYDHEADPDGRYAPVDYNTIDNAKIFADCQKYIDILEELSYRDEGDWGKYSRSPYQYKNILVNFRSNFKDMRASEYKVLHPMGLSFETADNPIAEFDAKLEELRTQLSTTEDSKDQRVQYWREQLLLQAATIKTVDDRILEFSSYNENMLSQFLYPPVAETPHQLPELQENLLTDEAMERALLEMNALPNEAIVPVVSNMEVEYEEIKPEKEEKVEEEAHETPLDRLRMYARSDKFNVFKYYVLNDDKVLTKEVLTQLLGLVDEDTNGNLAKLKAFYDKTHKEVIKEIKERQKKAIAEIENEKAEYHLDEIMGLADLANEEREREIAEYDNLKNQEAVLRSAPEVKYEPLPEELPELESSFPDAVIYEPEKSGTNVLPGISNEPITPNLVIPEVPKKVDQVMETTKEDIEREINSLTLALKYADKEEKAEIKNVISTLRIALKYA